MTKFARRKNKGRRTQRRWSTPPRLSAVASAAVVSAGLAALVLLAYPFVAVYFVLTTTTATRTSEYGTSRLEADAAVANDRNNNGANSESDLTDLSSRGDESADGGGGKPSFGCCLMIMDDNHYLVEFLAYHWYAMPLRHLTVLVDPKSRTSPFPVLDRWKNRIRVDVVDWTYPDALGPSWLNEDFLQHEQQKVGDAGGGGGATTTADRNDKGRNNNSTHVDDTAARKFRGTQLMFYQDCLKRYARRNWTSWVMIVDTGAFVFFWRRWSSPVACSRAFLSHPSVRDLLTVLLFNFVYHFGQNKQQTSSST